MELTRRTYTEINLTNKVQELTLKELADCLEFVFSLKKEIK